MSDELASDRSDLNDQKDKLDVGSESHASSLENVDCFRS